MLSPLADDFVVMWHVQQHAGNRPCLDTTLHRRLQWMTSLLTFSAPTTGTWLTSGDSARRSLPEKYRSDTPARMDMKVDSRRSRPIAKGILGRGLTSSWNLALPAQTFRAQ